MKKIPLLCSAIFGLLSAPAVFAQQEQVQITLKTSTGGQSGGVTALYKDQTVVETTNGNASYHDIVQSNSDAHTGYAPIEVPCAIMRHGDFLGFERRAFIGTETGSNNDTFALQTASLGKTTTNYDLEIVVTGMIYGVVGKIVDQYSGTVTPININPSGTATTTYSFSVVGLNGPQYYYDANPWVHLPQTLSKRVDRFYIVFSNNPTYSRPRFHFGQVQIRNSVLDWNVTNEAPVRSYQLEYLQGERWVSQSTIQKGDTYKFSLRNPGKYRVKALFLNGSADSSKVIAYEGRQQMLFSLYPNPTSGRSGTVSISFGKEQYGKSELLIIRPAGGVVYRTIIVATGARTIPIGNLEPGIYMVQILQQGKVVSAQQLVVQR